MEQTYAQKAETLRKQVITGITDKFLRDKLLKKLDDMNLLANSKNSWNETIIASVKIALANAVARESVVPDNNLDLAKIRAGMGGRN